jgi:hypothetical protein
MDVSIELLEVAVLLGEPARVSILWNLLDGQIRPAGELHFWPMSRHNPRACICLNW